MPKITTLHLEFSLFCQFLCIFQIFNVYLSTIRLFIDIFLNLIWTILLLQHAIFQLLLYVQWLCKISMFKYRARPRSCIYTSADLDAWMLPQYSNADVVTVSINNLQGIVAKNVIFSSVYMAEENNAPHTQWRNLLHIATKTIFHWYQVVMQMPITWHGA